MCQAEGLSHLTEITRLSGRSTWDPRPHPGDVRTEPETATSMSRFGRKPRNLAKNRQICEQDHAHIWRPLRYDAIPDADSRRSTAARNSPCLCRSSFRIASPAKLPRKGWALFPALSSPRALPVGSGEHGLETKAPSPLVRDHLIPIECVQEKRLFLKPCPIAKPRATRGMQVAKEAFPRNGVPQ